ncbi:MAG: hypothetical protein ACRDZV_00280 [Acidimicrobiia bacterium]
MARGQEGADVLRRGGQARAVAIGLLLTATLLLAPACSGDDDDGAIPTTSTTRRTTSTTTVTASTSTTSTGAANSVEQEITARYTAFWDVRFKANQNPVNPSHPGLREYATGPQLDNVLAETTRNRDQGVAFRRPEQSVYERRVRVVRVDGEMASLQDCVTNDGIVYRVSTGEVIDDSVNTRSLEAVMRLVDREWRLESTRVLQEWEGVAGCARAQDS